MSERLPGSAGGLLEARGFAVEGRKGATYGVSEADPDGRIVLRPGSSEEVIGLFADRVLSDEEALESLRRLHAGSLREGD